MVNSRCFAQGCKSGYIKGEKYSLFIVTKNNVGAWGPKVPRLDKQLSVNDVLCEKHFLKEDIIREVKTDTYSYPLKKPRLKEGALPFIWPNSPKYLTRPSVQRRPLIKKEHSKPAKRRKCQKQKDKEQNEDVNIIETSSSEADDGNVSELCKIYYSPNYLLSVLSSVDFVLKLPSNSWCSKILVSEIGEQTAVFFEMECLDNDVIIPRKVILTKNYLNIFVFGHLYYHFDRTEGVIFDEKKIETVNDFEGLLIALHNLSVCYGLSTNDVDTSDFTSSKYYKNESSMSWRHKECKYVFSKNEINFGRKRKYCLLCQNFKKTVKRFKNITKKTTT